MSTLKVFALVGSPRRGNTWRLVELFCTILTRFAGSLDYIIKRVDDFHIDFCDGCQRCIIEASKCHIEDDLDLVKGYIEKSDLFILASPVYLHNVSAQLKKFLDRTASWCHRPPFLGKYSVVVATTAGSGLLEVLKFLRGIVTSWGMICLAEIGAIMPTDEFLDKEKVETMLENVAIRIIRIVRREAKPRITAEDIVNFKHWKFKILEASQYLPHDYEYWRTNKLLDREYYYVEDIVEIPHEEIEKAKRIESQYDEYWKIIGKIYESGGIYINM